MGKVLCIATPRTISAPRPCVRRFFPYNRRRQQAEVLSHGIKYLRRVHVAVGSYALYVNTTGFSNNAVGVNALLANAAFKTLRGGWRCVWQHHRLRNIGIGGATLLVQSPIVSKTSRSGDSALGRVADGTNNIAVGPSWRQADVRRLECLRRKLSR